MAEKLFYLRTGFKRENVHHKGFSLFEEWRAAGRLGFFDLPVMTSLQEQTATAARRYLDRFDTLFVAGIGGSSLGLSAIMSASPGAGSRVCLIDSPDSGLIRRTVEERHTGRSAICVITKSGGTAETLSIFLELLKILGYSTPVIAITDPCNGPLRKLVQEKGWDSLPVPENVGGRFSVLSPVGMFPGAFQGICTDSILSGAEAVRGDFLRNGPESLAGNIAGAFLSTFRSHPVHVFMPYSDRLYQTALWFAQLWAESLGKARDLDGEKVNTGQTPVACRGPADQHSLVQLFMEGPADKTVTIVSEEFTEWSKPAEGEFSNIPSMGYLQGRNPDELRAAEAEATASALSERGLPVSRIVLPCISGEYLGQLLMSLEIATVLCGLALNINPLDQPGVERGKILTYKAMGREGY